MKNQIRQFSATFKEAIKRDEYAPSEDDEIFVEQDNELSWIEAENTHYRDCASDSGRIVDNLMERHQSLSNEINQLQNKLQSIDILSHSMTWKSKG